LTGDPEGLYRFRGRTCEGERFESTDPLSHDPPNGNAVFAEIQFTTVE
jgi:hypothetical protein